MTNIADLYLQVLIPDNNVIQRATSAILESYQDANSIFQVLEILKANSNPLIRRQAAIGLKTVLHNFWYAYSKGPSAQDIMNEIISSLKNESEPLIRHLIIYALEPICSHREDIWPRLIDDLALNCIHSVDEAALDVGLSLYGMIIPHLNEDLINEILPPLSEKIAFVFQALNNLIPTSSNLVSSLVSLFQPPIPDCLSNLVEILFTIFRVLLLNQSPYIYIIANDLSKIVSCEGVSSSLQHLRYLLELANDPTISPSVIQHVFTPISAIINDKFMEPVIFELVPIILSTVFKCASLTFIDDCITEQSDSLYIFSSLDSIPNYEGEGSDLFAFLSQFIENSSVQISFTSLLVFQFFIDNYPHIIADNLKQTVDFLIQQSNITNHHCICEQAMICMHHLISDLNGGLGQYSDSLLQVIINSVSVDHDQLIIKGLIAMSELFKTLNFDHSLIPTVLNLLISKIRKSPDIMNMCAFTLNTLIFSAGCDISPFTEQIAPLFFELIKLGESNYPQLKSYASESIARLLKNSQNEMLPFLEQSMTLLINQCSMSEDLTDLESGLGAFAILADSQIPQVTSSMQIAMEKSILVLQMECPVFNNDENESEESLPQVYETKQIAMKFINSLVKSHPEVFTELTQPCSVLLISHIRDCYETMTRIAAIKTLASFAYAKLINAEIVIKEYLQLNLLNEDEPFIVTKSFSVISKILFPEVSADIVSACIQLAIKGLLNRLQCQESEDCYMYDIEHSLFKLLSRVAQTHAIVFPVHKMLKLYTNKLKRRDSPHFISQAVVSFANYMISIKKFGLNNLIPGDIQQFIIKSILNSLSICDGTIQPYPLFAIKELFKEGVLDLNPSFLDRTFIAIRTICSMEYQGQPAYEETIAATVSLLYILFLLMGENFDTQTYLKIMISRLPVIFKRYSEDIYSSLILLFQRHPQIFDQFSAQILVGVARTLALPDDTLLKAGLSIENICQIVNFCKTLIANDPNSNQIISEAIVNQSGISILKQRLGQ